MLSIRASESKQRPRAILSKLAGLFGMECQSVIEDIDEITKQISVSVPSAFVAKEFDASLGKLSRSARINGFRPGKAPKKMVEKLLGDRVRFDVVQKLVQESLQGVYKTHKLEVVGDPEIDLPKFEPSEALEFKAKVSLLPQPVVANYKGRAIVAAKKVVKDSDLEQSLEQLRESKAELNAIEDRKDAQLGDVVALSVSVKTEGQDFSRPEPFVDVLGGGKLNSEVEKQLVGLLVGEEKEVSITADEDHANEELRGKLITYKANLHGVFSKKLPELTDDFVKTLAMGVEDLASLRAKIRGDLEAKAEEETRGNVQSALLDLLVKENPFKVPQVMIDEEIREMISRYGFLGEGKDARSVDVAPFRPQFSEFALNRIRCAILVDRIGEAEQIRVEDQDRERLIQELARRNGATVEAARRSLLDRSRIVSFLLEARRTKILEFLVANSVVEYSEEKTEAAAA
jgi:trigger factor